MRFINGLAFCIEHLGAAAKPPPCRVRAQNTIKNGRQDNQLLVPLEYPAIACSSDDGKRGEQKKIPLFVWQACPLFLGHSLWRACSFFFVWQVFLLFSYPPRYERSINDSRDNNDNFGNPDSNQDSRDRPEDGRHPEAWTYHEDRQKPKSSAAMYRDK